MVIQWLEDAVTDLHAIHDYILQENPYAADRIARRILEVINFLPEQPAMGRQGRVHGTRELIVAGTPYLVPYRVKKDEIQILRVFHCAMQWPENI